jgi:hypothetical protein
VIDEVQELSNPSWVNCSRLGNEIIPNYKDRLILSIFCMGMELDILPSQNAAKHNIGITMEEGRTLETLT